MRLLGTRIERPGTALVVIFCVGALLAVYGEIKGACLLVSLFAGIGLYKMLIA